MTTKIYKVNEAEAAMLLADVWNADLPEAGVGLLTEAIEITGSGRIAYLNVCFSSAVSSTLSVKRTRGAVSEVQALNGGANISADTLYQATVYAVPGETIDMIYGDNGGKYYLAVGAVVQNG